MHKLCIFVITIYGLRKEISVLICDKYISSSNSGPIKVQIQGPKTTS